MSTINKISAWVLMGCFLAYIVSGFDIQLRFLAPGFTSFVHLKYLFIPAQIAFTIHTSYALHQMMIKRDLWHYIGKGILGLYILFNIALFIVFLTLHS